MPQDDRPRPAIRAGGPADVGSVVALLDDRVAWLTDRGQTGQWGTTPFSAMPKRVAMAEGWAASSGLCLAVDEAGEAIGALVLGDAPDHVPTVAVPEVYVALLVTARRAAGMGVGAALVGHAVAEARAAGAALLRVDCWAGAPRLVQWYEEQGFRRVSTFDVGVWRGQLFEQHI
jgi:GNAT superfamily N-acetyltransferase